VKLPRTLDAVEVRVLGCLLEKEQATPEYYPLTLNALVSACNQRSSREPVMELEQGDVSAALDRLHAEVLVWPLHGERVPRFRHALDRWELDPETRAVITLLLLRGPQTSGELKSRSDRLHAFRSIDEVQAALERLAAGDEPLVVQLERRPGQKESRWAHLVAGEPEEDAVAARAAPAAEAASGRVDRLAELEERVARLEAELERLKEALGA
jgi:uncharacterized protein YceH (UPF0502 family)